MPYRDEFLKKLQELKEYGNTWKNDQESALKFKTVLRAKEISYQIGRFMVLLNNSPELFGGKAQRDAFFERHADVFPNKRFPHIETSTDYAEARIPEADYEKIFDALDEEFKDRPEVLENLFTVKCNPDFRTANHPMSDVVQQIKDDVDKLYGEENEKKELKDALDFANEELVEKTGPNLVDDAIDANSNKRHLKAAKEFDNFVKKNGLDSTTIKNKSGLKAVVSPGLTSGPKNYEIYKPFLDMGVSYDQDYKNKLLQLDALCQQEGLLTKASAGESGFKEYGLADYFNKNYALKRALTDYQKLTDEQQKKEALANIKNLTEDVKTVTDKYEKVFDFIEKNFDLENAALPGNLYSGRPVSVPDGNLEQWKPNLPPKFDFEKSPAVVFLNGFTQLKAACNANEVSLQEFLDNPVKSYLDGAKKYGEAEDRKIYLPPSEENTLGKRMAHVFFHSGSSYSEISAISMMGGRGMEFLYNTSPANEQSIDTVIKTSIIRDYSNLYNHDPDRLFGTYFDPDIDKIKNVFVAGDDVDCLYKVSPNYVNGECKIDPYVKDYSAAVRAHGNTPVFVEYNRIITALKDCFDEEEEMCNHPDIYLKSAKDTMNHFSHGALIAAGRQYFVDYLRENNLSLASVEDEDLRQEISDFMADPVQTFVDHHYEIPEDGLEDLNDIKDNFKKAWRVFGKKNSEAFMEKFEQNNQKPGGYNTGKDIPTILNDNRGGWWERWRGTTSPEYKALVKAAVASTDPDSPTHGDKEAMYVCAKAYRAHKLPNGRRPLWLSSTAKKRLEFCDSIINAYEQEKAAREAVNNPAPAQEQNNNIINQNDFQNQLQNDLGPKEVKDIKPDLVEEESLDQDPLEDNATI